MALYPNFPGSPHAILDPAMRWFPVDEALRESSSEKLMPPLTRQGVVGYGAAKHCPDMGYIVGIGFIVGCMN